MTEERIKAISFKCDEVGKYMKGSKKRFEWVVGLNNRTHTIVLDFSFISGKVKAYVDGRVLLENQIPLNTSFQHPFTLDGFALNLIQQGQNCELRLNNKVFSHLYTQEKTNQQFKQDESQFGISMNKDFMNKINSGGNKITLDIGGQKKNFSKKSKQEEGEWGAFGGIGFPSGFEAPPGMELPQQKGSTSGFGSEFDAPSKPQQAQQAPIDFFGDSEPSQPQQSSSSGSTDILGGDLLEGGSTSTVQPTATTPQQSSIESLYQQSMMNTNQLLFSTAVHQQQQYTQPQQTAGSFPTTSAGNQPLGAPTAITGTSLPFNTGLGLNQMFATGVPNTGFATGISAINPPSFPVITMNTGMANNVNTGAPTSTGNPNFQVGTGYQTGNINLNQLYQTGVQQQPTFGELTSLTTSSQQQQHAGMMFQTTANTTPTNFGNAFNTTVPATAANKDIFDLM